MDREGLERQVKSVARQNQESRRQMGLATQGKYRIRQILVLRAEREGLEHQVRSNARQNQQNRRQLGLATQVQQCFGKGPTSISPRVDRGAEHLDGLVAPLVSLVHLVCLVCLVYLVGLVHLVYPVSLVQPNKQDKPNKPNNGLHTLGDFLSILLTVTGIYAGTDTTTCAEGYETPRAELPPVTVGRNR